MSDWKSQENEALIRRYYESNLRDIKAFELLCENVRGLIRSIAKKTAFAYSCLDYEDHSGLYTARTKYILEDLESEGFDVLCTEIQTGQYDPEKAKFSTYIYPRIQGAMHQYMRTQFGPIALTRAESDFARQVKKLFFTEKIPLKEIVERTHRKKWDVVQAISLNTEPISYWDLMPQNEDKEDRLTPDERLEELTDPSPRPDIAYYHEVCLELLFPLFLTLGEADQNLIGHYFGVYGFEKQTLDKIALTEMLTVDGVLKAVDAAIRQLRENYQESDLKIWVDAHKMVRRAIRDASVGKTF
ncbi:MAG: hypothetical protein II955_01580 [Clostridia bacterium]|nr:hypothetical protein [Clostridia bacterium]